MATGSQVIGEFVEGIRIEVGRKILRMVLVCPGFIDLAFSASLGLLSGCVDGNGARYWWLNEGSWRAIKEIKSPCNCRGFGGMKALLHSCNWTLWAATQHHILPISPVTHGATQDAVPRNLSSCLPPAAPSSSSSDNSTVADCID